jgi:transposase
LLPGHPRQGHRWNNHQPVIDGIFFRTRAGCPWRDLPERFGNWKTVYNEHDQADRRAGNRLEMPVTVLQQNLGAAFGSVFARSWQAWAPDLEHTTLGCGYFLPEEAPAEVARALRGLLGR